MSPTPNSPPVRAWRRARSNHFVIGCVARVIIEPTWHLTLRKPPPAQQQSTRLPHRLREPLDQEQHLLAPQAARRPAARAWSTTFAPLPCRRPPRAAPAVAATPRTAPLLVEPLSPGAEWEPAVQPVRPGAAIRRLPFGAVPLSPTVASASRAARMSPTVNARPHAAKTSALKNPWRMAPSPSHCCSLPSPGRNRSPDAKLTLRNSRLGSDRDQHGPAAGWSFAAYALPTDFAAPFKRTGWPWGVLR